MSALATVDELKARCDWTFDADEERAASGYLEEASDLVRAYGKDAWESSSAPRMAKNIAISAVRRFMRNPEGYTQSRAGDETLGWSDLGHDSATIYLTAPEQRLLRSLAGRGGLTSAPAVAWGPHKRLEARDTVQVPVSGWPGEKPFPMESEPIWQDSGSDLWPGQKPYEPWGSW